MSRILRIELRRSAAAGAALVLLLAGVLLLFTEPRMWSSGWMPFAMALRTYLVLLWPLALAVGAWQVRREQRSNVEELFAGTARPLAQRVVPTLVAMATAVLSGYLVMAAVAVPLIIGSAGYLPAATFAVLAVGALSLVAAVWFGMGVGRLLPSPVTAPALAVAGIGLLLLLTPTVVGRRAWLATIFSPTQGLGLVNEFRTVAGRVSAAQAIWLVALAVTGAVLLAAGSRRARMAALLPAVIGAAVAILVIPRGADYVESPVDPVARELVCAQGSPRVCVARTHASVLSEVTPLARQGLLLLAKLPNAPTVAMENLTFLDEHIPPLPSGTVLFEVSVGDGHLTARTEFLPRMLNAAGVSAGHCPDGLNRPVSLAAAYWLMEREPPDDPWAPAEENAQTRALWQGLRELPEREAVARVAAVRAAALACEDLDQLLTGGAA